MKLIHHEDATEIWARYGTPAELDMSFTPYRVEHLRTLLAKALYADDLYSARVIVTELQKERKEAKENEVTL